MHYATNIHEDKYAPDDDDAVAPECITDNPRWVLMEPREQRDLYYLMMLSAVNSIYHWWQMNET